MNERIRELAEQATTVEHGVIQPRTVATVYHFDKQKFAELIVRECMSIISNKVTVETNEDYREGFHRAQQFIWQDIKKHFGVEE